VSRYNTIIDKFVLWGKSSNKLQAALVFGSQARTEKYSDIYSDLDVIMIVNDHEYFLHSKEWLEHIGNVHVSFIENTIAGGKERRIIFDDALDVDFIILPISAINESEKINQILPMLSKGYRILIDKIGLEQVLTPTLEHSTHYKFLSNDEFLNLVNDFWFHSVWTTKKLLRGELWVAKSCLDNYMKQKLLSIIELHARVINETDYNTWHDGRFLDEWADKSITCKLPHTFAHYNRKDIENALLATMNLFRTIALEVAKKANYEYPNKSDEYTTAWVKSSIM